MLRQLIRALGSVCSRARIAKPTRSRRPCQVCVELSNRFRLAGIGSAHSADTSLLLSHSTGEPHAGRWCLPRAASSIFRSDFRNALRRCCIISGNGSSRNLLLAGGLWFATSTQVPHQPPGGRCKNRVRILRKPEARGARWQVLTKQGQAARQNACFACFAQVWLGASPRFVRASKKGPSLPIRGMDRIGGDGPLGYRFCKCGSADTRTGFMYTKSAKPPQ